MKEAKECAAKAGRPTEKKRNGFKVLRILRADNPDQLRRKLEVCAKKGWAPAKGALGESKPSEHNGSWWLTIERFHDFDELKEDEIHA